MKTSEQDENDARYIGGRLDIGGGGGTGLDSPLPIVLGSGDGDQPVKDHTKDPMPSSGMQTYRGSVGEYVKPTGAEADAPKAGLLEKLDLYVLGGIAVAVALVVWLTD